MAAYETLLRPTEEGLYCPPGDFYIDPVRPVARALVTHGHADHARPGNGAVLATRRTLDIMALRYGVDFTGQRQVADWGTPIAIDDVTVTFHPAGHVLGSAQIAVEHKGTRIVASGDYKRTADATSEPFEPVPCDVFITEATFGLPVFRHPSGRHEIGRLLESLRQFPERAHVVGAYALGKAQRVIRMIRDEGYDAPIYIHGALVRLCEYYAQEGIDLGPLLPATLGKGRIRRRHRGGPALGFCRPLGAALSRSGRLFRQRLDAGAPAGASARRGTAADHLRPLRLGRVDRHPVGAEAGRNLGHPRAGGSPGALVRAAGHARTPAAPCGL
jgi:DNA ligase-associated putative exonuclease